MKYIRRGIAILFLLGIVGHVTGINKPSEGCTQLERRGRAVGAPLCADGWHAVYQDGTYYAVRDR